MPGFRTRMFNLYYDASQPSSYNFPLSVASTAETVEVTATAPQVETKSGTNEYHGATRGATLGGTIVNVPFNGRDTNSLTTLAPGVSNQNAASANVMNLQRRVA